MNYCLNSTKDHRISKTHGQCITDINSLISSEGYITTKPFFNNNEVVINLDLAEAICADLECRNERNKSMDMAFGLRSLDGKKIQMLLVELKFNVKDVYSLKKIDLEGKVDGSCLVLGNNPPIYQRFIFIVKSEHLQEAISRFYRMNPKLDSKYVALDIQTLKSEYFNIGSAA